jgi:hypothetical protein
MLFLGLVCEYFATIIITFAYIMFDVRDIGRGKNDVLGHFKCSKFLWVSCSSIWDVWLNTPLQLYLLSHDPLSSLAYPMITNTPLVASNLPIYIVINVNLVCTCDTFLKNQQLTVYMYSPLQV